eukprot:502473_1
MEESTITKALMFDTNPKYDANKLLIPTLLLMDPSKVFMVTSKYLKEIESKQAPKDIVLLCCSFCIVYSPPNSLHIISQAVWTNKYEDFYENVSVKGHNDIYHGECPLRITVSGNMTICDGSTLRIAANPYAVVFDVNGDFELKRHAKLHFFGGDLLIRCNNLKMGHCTRIQTIPMHEDDKEIDDFLMTNKYGNIWIHTKNNFIVKWWAHIKSGDIKIQCDGNMQIGGYCSMKGIRHSVDVNIGGKLIQETEEEIFEGLKLKNVRVD